MKTELRNGFRKEDSAMRIDVRSKGEECQCFSTSSILIQPKEDAKYKAHFFKCFLPCGRKPEFLLELISNIAQFLYNHVTAGTEMKVQG